MVIKLGIYTEGRRCLVVRDLRPGDPTGHERMAHERPARGVRVLGSCQLRSTRHVSHLRTTYLPTLRQYILRPRMTWLSELVDLL